MNVRARRVLGVGVTTVGVFLFFGGSALAAVSPDALYGLAPFSGGWVAWAIFSGGVVLMGAGGWLYGDAADPSDSKALEIAVLIFFRVAGSAVCLALAAFAVVLAVRALERVLG